jgi:hypothetical protein
MWHVKVRSIATGTFLLCRVPYFAARWGS